MALTILSKHGNRIIKRTSKESWRLVDFSKAFLCEAHLADLDLSGANFYRCLLSEADLTGANLSGASMRRASCVDAVLEGADLSGADLTQADIRGANLVGANLKETRFHTTIFNDQTQWSKGIRIPKGCVQVGPQSDLSGCHFPKFFFGHFDLNGACFDDTKLMGASFISASLRGASFRHARCSLVDFMEADIQSADITGVTLDGARLCRCNLTGVTGAIKSAKGAIFNLQTVMSEELRDELVTKGAYLMEAFGAVTSANLAGAILFNLNLIGIDFSHSNLTGAHLFQANLSGANLSHVSACHANFSGANLSGANLKYADLSHANFLKADLTGADLTGANLNGTKVERP